MKVKVKKQTYEEIELNSIFYKKNDTYFKIYEDYVIQVQTYDKISIGIGVGIYKISLSLFCGLYELSPDGFIAISEGEFNTAFYSTLEKIKS
jgi:hypothetical protein